MRPVATAAVTALAVACTLLTVAPAEAGTKADPGFRLYPSGSTTDVSTTPSGGVLLAGGGTDSNAAMTWLLSRGGARSAGRYGDVVVLRTSGSTGYNSYLLGLGANSVTSIVISSAAGANRPEVAAAIGRAEAVFIAGGDQATYVNLWSGTALQAAVNQRIAAGYPIGGTSAGLAVLGEHVFAALSGTAYSATVLANPYDPTATLRGPLFAIPVMAGILPDSHFAVRDRMGRLVTFLARLQQDGRAAAPRGIGVDEGSAVAITPAGAASVLGAGRGAYLLTVTSGISRTCAPGIPLTYSPVTAQRVPVGSTFAVSTWSSTDGGARYTLSAGSGRLTSTSGSAY